MDKPDIRMLFFEPYSFKQPDGYFETHDCAEVYTFEWQSICGREDGEFVHVEDYQDLLLAYLQLKRQPREDGEKQ